MTSCLHIQVEGVAASRFQISVRSEDKGSSLWGEARHALHEEQKASWWPQSQESQRDLHELRNLGVQGSSIRMQSIPPSMLKRSPAPSFWSGLGGDVCAASRGSSHSSEPKLWENACRQPLSRIQTKPLPGQWHTMPEGKRWKGHARKQGGGEWQGTGKLSKS